jgi:hypothetical protein
VLSCTDRLVKLFVQGIAVVLSSGADTDSPRYIYMCICLCIHIFMYVYMHI